MILEKIIVFVKAPRPGFVKTRLARSLGADAACAAYTVLAERLLANLNGMPSVELRHTPDDARALIQPWLRNEWGMKEQGPGDLGERMDRAFAECFAGGANKAIIIGSDCPDVSPADIQTATSALDSCDVVVGPATDGGYWLIGLREHQPALFQGMPWSSEAVLAETLRRSTVAGLRVHQLRTLADIDTESDWRQFLSRRGAAT